MQSRTDHSALPLSPVPPLPGPGSAQSVHACLEHIWQIFRLRARLFLLEEGELVLRDCVGDYCTCPEIGLKVNPGSIVWAVFRQGTPANLTKVDERHCKFHSLPEPVDCKAVIPLMCSDALFCEGPGTLGVLVVDSEISGRSIDERDFRYLEVFGMLLSEVLVRSVLIERIRQIQRRKTEMAEAVSHIFRNRFMVIGGFALRLTKALEDSALKQYARIILKETAKGEKALKRWRKLHSKGEWDDESEYLC